MKYQDLTINQRITAKGNALKYYGHPSSKSLLKRVSSCHPDLYRYNFPEYLVQYKTNGGDYESVPSDWWSGGIAENH